MEEKIREVFSDQEFVKDFFESATAEEARKKLENKGIKLETGQIEKLFAAARSLKDTEISDIDLENVAGGTVETAFIIMWLCGVFD